MLSGLLMFNMPHELAEFLKETSFFSYANFLVVAGFALLATAGFMVMISFYVLLATEKKLQKPKVEKRIGGLYSDIDTAFWYKRVHPLLFILRRAAIVGLALYFQDFASIQLMGLIYMNLFFLIYSSVKPFRDSKANRINLFNEYLTLNLTVALVLFSDFCHDPLT